MDTFISRINGYAAEVITRSKPFTEEEIDLSVLILKVGGRRLLSIANKATGCPSEGFLRDHCHLPQLRVSASIHDLFEDALHNFKAMLNVLATAEGGHGWLDCLWGFMVDEVRKPRLLVW